MVVPGPIMFDNTWSVLAYLMYSSNDRVIARARLCKYLAALLRGHPARVCVGYAPLPEMCSTHCIQINGTYQVLPVLIPVFSILPVLNR